MIERLSKLRYIAVMQLWDRSVPHKGNADLRNTDSDFRNDIPFYKKLVQVREKVLSYILSFQLILS